MFLSSYRKSEFPNLLISVIKGVQGAVGVTLTADKALNVHNLKTITDDHLSTVPKKRPIKSTLTLSERFAGDSISPPKVSRISTELIGNNLSLKAKGPLGKTKSRASPVEPQIASGGKQTKKRLRKTCTLGNYHTVIQVILYSNCNSLLRRRLVGFYSRPPMSAQRSMKLFS